MVTAGWAMIGLATKTCLALVEIVRVAGRENQIKSEFKPSYAVSVGKYY